MNPKHKPWPITSFIEDNFEPDKAPTKFLESNHMKKTRIKNNHRYYIILFIRIIMNLIAIGTAVGLYILVDNFIGS